MARLALVEVTAVRVLGDVLRARIAIMAMQPAVVLVPVACPDLTTAAPVASEAGKMMVQATAGPAEVALVPMHPMAAALAVPADGATAAAAMPTVLAGTWQVSPQAAVMASVQAQTMARSSAALCARIRVTAAQMALMAWAAAAAAAAPVLNATLMIAVAAAVAVAVAARAVPVVKAAGVVAHRLAYL
jgi:hypothetical protein